MNLVKFYRTAIMVLLLGLLVSAVVFWVGNKFSRLELELLPREDSPIPWVPLLHVVPANENHRVDVLREGEVLEFSFYRTDESRWPYTAFGLSFYEALEPKTSVDFSPYSVIEFKVMCSTANTLALVIHTFDPVVTDLSDDNTYRYSDFYFVCDQKEKTVSISLDDIITPEWWLERYSLPYSDRSDVYDRTQVFDVVIVGTARSPKFVDARVQVRSLRLTGSKPVYYRIAIAVIIFMWVVIFLWAFRRYSKALVNEVRERVGRDQQLLAYKKLSLAPQKDKEKEALLRYIAKDYGNSELSLEVASSDLGINRTKINELLKEELGLTFAVYLNKLRLTEAARLLSVSAEVNVSRVAHAVGYNNSSYFSKLFKAEYGCTPKSFKMVYNGKNSHAPEKNLSSEACSQKDEDT